MHLGILILASIFLVHSLADPEPLPHKPPKALIRKHLEEGEFDRKRMTLNGRPLRRGRRRRVQRGEYRDQEEIKSKFPAFEKTQKQDEESSEESGAGSRKRRRPAQFEPTEPRKRPIATVNSYNKVNDDGSYTYGFESEDGTFKEETRGANGIVMGKYGYVDPNGQKREFTYTSGHTGNDSESDDYATSAEQTRRKNLIKKLNLAPNVHIHKEREELSEYRVNLNNAGTFARNLKNSAESASISREEASNSKFPPFGKAAEGKKNIRRRLKVFNNVIKDRTEYFATSTTQKIYNPSSTPTPNESPPPVYYVKKPKRRKHFRTTPTPSGSSEETSGKVRYDPKIKSLDLKPRNPSVIDEFIKEVSSEKSGPRIPRINPNIGVIEKFLADTDSDVKPSDILDLDRIEKFNKIQNQQNQVSSNLNARFSHESRSKSTPRPETISVSSTRLPQTRSPSGGKSPTPIFESKIVYDAKEQTYKNILVSKIGGKTKTLLGGNYNEQKISGGRAPSSGEKLARIVSSTQAPDTVFTQKYTSNPTPTPNHYSYQPTPTPNQISYQPTPSTGNYFLKSTPSSRNYGQFSGKIISQPQTIPPTIYQQIQSYPNYIQSGSGPGPSSGNFESSYPARVNFPGNHYNPYRDSREIRSGSGPSPQVERFTPGDALPGVPPPNYHYQTSERNFNFHLPGIKLSSESASGSIEAGYPNFSYNSPQYNPYEYTKGIYNPYDIFSKINDGTFH